jgi:molybdenum cofactor cytidylyltransferase
MIAAVILAAGTSSRLGRPKQLLPLGDRTVIEHVVDHTLAPSVDRVIVVLGHEAVAVRNVLEGREVEIVFNGSYLEGQSTSLLAGIRELGEDVEAVIVVLGDQPGVSPDAIDRVIALWRKTGKPIVTPMYGSTRSHPILFARSVFPELLAITGDKGARDVIRLDPSRVEVVDIGQPDVPADIDTEDAYRDLLATWNK